MAHDPTEIYRADSIQQAHLLVGFLEDYDIEAKVIADAEVVAGGRLGWASLARIVVPKEQAAAARQLVLKFEDELREGKLRIPDKSGLDDEDDVWEEWPTCPACGQKRQALCSICGTAGTDFPLMDIIRSGGREQVLLFCQTCDDHFRPKFYRLCHACGHDYGEGIPLGTAGPTDREPISPRVWIVVGGVAAVLAAIVGYFAWILA
jgi:hypothetical protein